MFYHKVARIDITVGFNVIVDPETATILPPNSIGELWISSSENYPENFWALPIHTEKYMRAKPIYISLKDESSSFDFDMEVDQIIENGTTIFKHTLKTNFIRTGIFGFILDKNTSPQNEEPLLFVVAKRQDVILQKVNTGITSGDDFQKQYFFSNHLSKIFHRFSYGINAR